MMHLRRTLCGLWFCGMFTTVTPGLALSQSPRVEDLLARRPIHPVAVSTPTAAELPACKIETANYPKPANGPAPTGLILRDGQGRILRQFIDVSGSGRPNLVYFYLNGQEVYREVDASGNGKPDQFRWLGIHGGKWGADRDEDGLVDQWYVLSPEELSQELFLALQTKNMKRFEALFPTEEELKSLNLPPVEIEKIRSRVSKAGQKFTATSGALNLSESSKWVHLETGLPVVIAADAFAGREDFVKQPSAIVLYEVGDGKTAQVFSVGEMIQLGRTWKLIDGPSPGASGATMSDAVESAGIVVPPEARPFLESLANVKPATSPADLSRYHTERAGWLEKIVGVTSGEGQLPWLKQLLDAQAAIAESQPHDPAALGKLKALLGQLEQSPQKPAASYAAFRTLTAEYTIKMANADVKAIADVQKWWRDQLENFIHKYPKTDDTPEAMMRLAVGHEYVGKDGEAAAKATYDKLASEFPNHPYAPRARGAVTRLESEGKPFQLPAATTLDGKPFSTAGISGKVTYVVFWGNVYQDPAGQARVTDHLKSLAELSKAYGDKGFQILTISVDEEAASAVQALNAAGGVPGTHLYLPGGLDRSPLAVAWGIQFLPHGFLLGKDGTVTNRNAQVTPQLKDEIEKLLK